MWKLTQQLTKLTLSGSRLISPVASVGRLGIRSMSREPAAKISRTIMKIGTHNGTFHCDEVLACFMLRQLPEYKDAEIVRTRDPALLETCDIVVDVGGVYDPSKHRYDHHQRSFTDNMSSLRSDKKWVTKLSSAGLVYLHFGERVLSELLKRPVDDRLTQIVYDKVYEHFVEEVDAIDNGIDATDEKPRYCISTNLSSRVGHFNPRWNETSSEEDAKIRFYKAMNMVGAELEDRVSYYRDGWWPARQLVETALEKRFEVDKSGEIMRFEQGGCPWKDHLLTIEEQQEFDPQVKFILYPDQSGSWRVQCVPKERNTFENRLSLLKEWCGVRDEELSRLSGIPACIFVHANGFIGGNKTYDGALEMAKRTLANKPTL